jgi:hypothetical protein
MVSATVHNQHCRALGAADDISGTVSMEQLRVTTLFTFRSSPKLHISLVLAGWCTLLDS